MYLPSPTVNDSADDSRAPSVMDFVYPEDQELVRRQAAERISAGATHSYEFRLSQPDGS